MLHRDRAQDGRQKGNAIVFRTAQSDRSRQPAPGNVAHRFVRARAEGALHATATAVPVGQFDASRGPQQNRSFDDFFDSPNLHADRRLRAPDRAGGARQ